MPIWYLYNHWGRTYNTGVDMNKKWLLAHKKVVHQVGLDVLMPQQEGGHCHITCMTHIS